MRRTWLMTGVAAAVVAATAGTAGASARAHPAGHSRAARAPAAMLFYSPAFGINDQGVIVGT